MLQSLNLCVSGRFLGFLLSHKPYLSGQSVLQIQATAQTFQWCRCICVCHANRGLIRIINRRLPKGGRPRIRHNLSWRLPRRFVTLHDAARDWHKKSQSTPRREASWWLWVLSELAGSYENLREAARACKNTNLREPARACENVIKLIFIELFRMPQNTLRKPQEGERGGKERERERERHRETQREERERERERKKERKKERERKKKKKK